MKFGIPRILPRLIILLSFLFGFWCTGYWITRLYPGMSSKIMYGEFETGEMDDKENQNNEPSDVLILTYMRSGSTFIGKLLGWRNDTFYWYEPFFETHMYEFFSENGQVCSYGKQYCRPVIETGQNPLQSAFKFLLNIYKCKDLMQYFPRESLKYAGDELHAGFSGKVFADCKSNVFQNCTRRRGSPVRCKNCKVIAVKSKSCSRFSLNPCYTSFTDRCATSIHKVTKVLRMATVHAEYLLIQHKRLKLIQVFRDPRAVLYSRRKARWYYLPEHGFTLLEDALTLCKRMDKDIAAVQKLKKLFPGRVQILQYEDFKDPLNLVISLYRFLNMKLTQSAKALFTEPCANGSREGFHPDSFRYHLGWSTIQHIDRICHNVLGSLGLRIFKSKEELLNASVYILRSGSRPFAFNGKK